MYKYILFDVDNTLLDFNKGERCALESVLAHFPLEFSDAVYQRYHKINDDLWKLLEVGKIEKPRLRELRFEMLFDEFGFNGKEFASDVSARFLVAMMEQAQLMDGAVEVLEALYKKYDLYIITNASAATQKKRLSKTPFDKYFKKYFISDDMGVHKPQKEFFERVVEEIGSFDHGDYLVVGDSLTSDIKGAVDFGIDSCYFDPHGIGAEGISPTYTIRKLTDLLKIV